MILRSLALLALVLVVSPSWAQQPVPVPVQIQPEPEAPASAASPAADPAAPAVASVPASPEAAVNLRSLSDPAPDDGIQRLALAQKLQSLMPAATLLESVIATQSQALPDNDRAAFRERILGAVDQKKLEAVSTKAFADLFTVPEFNLMLAYFGAPEARAIAGKMQTYQNMLQPEIARMLDNALMQVRPEQPKAQ